MGKRRAFFDFGCCGIFLLPLLLLPFALLLLPVWAILFGVFNKPGSPKPKNAPPAPPWKTEDQEDGAE